MITYKTDSESKKRRAYFNESLIATIIYQTDGDYRIEFFDGGTCFTATLRDAKWKVSEFIDGIICGKVLEAEEKRVAKVSRRMLSALRHTSRHCRDLPPSAMLEIKAAIKEAEGES